MRHLLFACDFASQTSTRRAKPNMHTHPVRFVACSEEHAPLSTVISSDRLRFTPGGSSMSFSARSHEDQRLLAPFWLPRMPVAGQQLLLRSARQVLLRSSTFTYLLSLLLPRQARTFFWVWYAYLRWVDDTVDDGSGSQQDGCKFLDRQ